MAGSYNRQNVPIRDAGEVLLREGPTPMISPRRNGLRSFLSVRCGNVLMAPLWTVIGLLGISSTLIGRLRMAAFSDIASFFTAGRWKLSATRDYRRTGGAKRDTIIAIGSASDPGTVWAGISMVTAEGYYSDPDRPQTVPDDLADIE
jgi:hypothetical protein